MEKCAYCKEEIEDEREAISVEGKKYHNFNIECLAAAAKLTNFDDIEHLCEGCNFPIDRISAGIFFSSDGKYVHYNEDCIISYITHHLEVK